MCGGGLRVWIWMCINLILVNNGYYCWGSLFKIEYCNIDMCLGEIYINILLNFCICILMKYVVF